MAALAALLFPKMFLFSAARGCDSGHFRVTHFPCASIRRQPFSIVKIKSTACSPLAAKRIQRKMRQKWRHVTFSECRTSSVPWRGRCISFWSMSPPRSRRIGRCWGVEGPWAFRPPRGTAAVHFCSASSPVESKQNKTFILKKSFT